MADDNCRPPDPDDCPCSPELLTLEERAASGLPFRQDRLSRLINAHIVGPARDE